MKFTFVKRARELHVLHLTANPLGVGGNNVGPTQGIDEVGLAGLLQS